MGEDDTYKIPPADSLLIILVTFNTEEFLTSTADAD